MRVHPPIHMRCAIGPPFQIYPTPHDVTFVSANSQCSSHAYPTSSILDVPRNDFLLMDAKTEPRAVLSLAIPLTSLFTQAFNKVYTLYRISPTDAKCSPIYKRNFTVSILPSANITSFEAVTQ
ncbi:hypothetical protein FOTG_01381 [Fusarium oxysporum f. sp. vasinfectum 25433]|uniref:Uncharacterized protein n=1 Tax=Fusarium oxysporum f. sp. vasinfectum 25433 TaxID=1089449 RepID=X0M8X1_FUSOX|nr:hypothetical protein FOTG_01381 [Fusarium oxysporum f. sp. vasinfectum 25433]EXM34588.1 hypothetical protein FOTG_01381 [Fusarium oxysporum f. sp. vasinfectum 25433]